MTEQFAWQEVLQRVASFCHTEGGRQRVLALTPNLTVPEIESVWYQVESLEELANRGYLLPSLELPDLGKVFTVIDHGQVVDGQELLSILAVLIASKRWYTFCKNFANQCSTLRRFQSSFLTLPRLSKLIEQTVDSDGEIKDTASKELQTVRKQKKHLTSDIEEKLRRMIHQRKFAPYLRDDFITKRNDRYVIPLRIDGNGRVAGTAITFSKSRETMFFEPQAIAQANSLLQTLDVAENLACYQILQNVTAEVVQEYESLKLNYQTIVTLDALNAQALFAKKFEANPVTLTDKPLLNLKNMCHPLLLTEENNKVVRNSVALKVNTLIISGANAGGKTVMLKAIGLLHLMAKAGLMITADRQSEIFIFNNLHLVIDDEQSINYSLSTFSSHLLRLQKLLTVTSNKDLVLIDEITTGTDPDTGAALAQAILEHLAERQVMTVVTSHYNRLKELAYIDDRFRNASMQFSTESLQPTYRLQLDMPGQSFGLEISRHLGLPTKIIVRARQLRGDRSDRFEAALAQLQMERQELQKEKDRINANLLKLQTYQERWRRDSQEIKRLQEKLTQQDEQLPQHPSVAQVKQELDPVIPPPQKRPPPGRKLNFSQASIGLRVYCVPLQKETVIDKIGRSANDPIVVNLGNMRVTVQLSDLRIT